MRGRSGTALPSFFIAGAMRSGTTSLTRYLDAHPDVFMAKPKEIHFFDLKFDKGLEWYSRHFIAAGASAAVGEATPSYMYLPEAIRRMATRVPDARLIVVLRDPVDRAYSHYWLRRNLGSEQLDFRSAIAEDAERVAMGDPRRSCPYLDMGRYLRQLQTICEHYPRAALHVVLLDELRDDPAATYASLCQHLGIDRDHRPGVLGKVVNRNVSFRSVALRRAGGRLPKALGRFVGYANTRRSGSYPPMDPRLRAELTEFFEPDNVALAEWLGIDLSGWLSRPGTNSSRSMSS